MSRAYSKRAKQSSSKASAASPIPAPFSKAPSSLGVFLERLDPAQVHITHVDRLPQEHKRHIFYVPVALNGAIALLLAWRLYVAVPTYLILLQTLLGHTTTATVDTENTTFGHQIRVLLGRTMMFALDFLLFRFVGPWPLTFFAEQPANPFLWRWTLGFQKEEVVVRVSRNWGTEELMKGTKRGDENPFFKTRILPAIEREFMRKTGYLMMDKDWDLEFELMLDAHALAARGQLRIGELDKLLLAFQEGVGWLAWRWESEVDVIESRRHKVVAFKEKLTALGKESLFWKWTEIVEEERDADGGFTAEKQQKVAERVQQEFEKHGVDFDDLVKSIGGLEEMPSPSA